MEFSQTSACYLYTITRCQLASQDKEEKSTFRDGGISVSVVSVVRDVRLRSALRIAEEKGWRRGSWTAQSGNQHSRRLWRRTLAKKGKKGGGNS